MHKAGTLSTIMKCMHKADILSTIMSSASKFSLRHSVLNKFFHLIIFLNSNSCRLNSSFLFYLFVIYYTVGPLLRGHPDKRLSSLEWLHGNVNLNINVLISVWDNDRGTRHSLNQNRRGRRPRRFRLMDDEFRGHYAT